MRSDPNCCTLSGREPTFFWAVADAGLFVFSSITLSSLKSLPQPTVFFRLNPRLLVYPSNAVPRQGSLYVV